MTDDPSQPFQPPRQPPPPSLPGDGSSGGGSFGYALLGVILGLCLGIIGPPLVWGLLASLLQIGGVPSAIGILVPMAVVLVGLPWAYIAVVKRLDPSVPDQASMRSAMVVTGYIALGLWGLVLVVFGLCIALLAGAY